MSSPKIDKWIYKMWYIDVDIYYVYVYIHTQWNTQPLKN